MKLTYRHSQLFPFLFPPLLSFFASLLSEELKDKILSGLFEKSKEPHPQVEEGERMVEGYAMSDAY